MAPRGSTLGHTSYMPKEDQYVHTRVQLKAKMDIAMGGRAAEELMFGAESIATGVEPDLQARTKTLSVVIFYY